MNLWLWSSLAVSQPRLDYKTEIEDRVLTEVGNFLREGKEDQAEEYLHDFERELFASARLHYELALQYNTQNQIDKALIHYDMALVIDPHLQSALYDRAEILLLQGKVDKAQHDLDILVKDGIEHWVVYFRLAEIYAEKGNGPLFEENLLQAIRYGFSLPLLLESGEKWKRYVEDPALREYLHRIIQLYGDETIWDSLQH
jgi:tetratricopeptide (TPR) repeat protein